MTRWLRWNLVCLRGRRCADVRAETMTNLPTGATFVIRYTCGGCGTRYITSALALGDDSFAHAERRRDRTTA